MAMKAYVKIQSEKSIYVTPGLQHQDVTNPDAHVADRLKVSPLWPRCTVLIKKGVHWYPSEITEWRTVRALERDKVLTIGESSDSPTDTPLIEKDKLKRDLSAMKGSLEDAAK